MKILVIDKTIISTKILLVDEKGRILKKNQKKIKGSFLPIIENILKSIKSVQSTKLTNEVKGIIVVAGPDTFSISRSSVTIANTLSYVWNIPVVGISREDFKNEEELVKLGVEKVKKARIGKFAIPVYDREPNIT